MDPNRLHEMVSVLIKTLRRAPEGRRVTTAQLLSDAGFERKNYNGLDLVEIRFAFFEAAERDGFTLEPVPCESREAAMPYNLEYVLRI